MKRKIVTVLLALGTVGGFASGFASLACRAKMRRGYVHHHLQEKVTDICAEAMRRAKE